MAAALPRLPGLETVPGEGLKVDWRLGPRLPFLPPRSPPSVRAQEAGRDKHGAAL